MDFPNQQATDRRASAVGVTDTFDMREHLTPRRLTLAMWDQAFVLRHAPGGSFADFDRVLDETVERGYNTVRLDPMPQWIDLSRPERVLKWPDPKMPLMPWCWNTGVEGPVGEWIIAFMEKLLARPFLNYTLSGWWFCNVPPAMSQMGPPVLRLPRTHEEGAEMWIGLLREWKQRFGFDRLVYLDLANEVPFFFPGFRERLKDATGADWDAPVLSAAQIQFVAAELNGALKLLRREFPELRYTCSIHGDLRWLDIPVEFDCLDVHFYADADPRWADRTKFQEFIKDGLFTNGAWHAELSKRCGATRDAIAPILRARQRYKLAQFAAWARQRGAPLTTSESWASWFYYDTPELDWGWLLEWAGWSVDDAIDHGMWGWTPHNYVQPQFANWQDVKWHQKLTQRFLKS
ncbi:MAG: cellulase-like family protein [bacterium]